jgi:hypothetical protein
MGWARDLTWPQANNMFSFLFLPVSNVCPKVVLKYKLLLAYISYVSFELNGPTLKEVMNTDWAALHNGPSTISTWPII